MTREARIRRLGDTLQQIDEALGAADLSTLSPEKLLDFKLKYTAALNQEYSAPAYMEATGDAETTLEAFKDIHRRAAAGEIDTNRAKTELNILDHMVDGYNRKNPFLDFA